MNDRLTIPDKKIPRGTRRTVIDTREVKEQAMTFYWALKEYEDTGLTPKQLKESRRWIPVEERLPEEGITVWVTVKHSDWISDYGSECIPREKWEYHPENNGVYKGKYEEGAWWYEEEYGWIRCSGEPEEARDLEVIYDTVTAWMPLPRPYQEKEN